METTPRKLNWYEIPRSPANVKRLRSYEDKKSAVEYDIPAEYSRPLFVIDKIQVRKKESKIKHLFLCLIP